MSVFPDVKVVVFSCSGAVPFLDAGERKILLCLSFFFPFFFPLLCKSSCTLLRRSMRSTFLISFSFFTSLDLLFQALEYQIFLFLPTQISYWFFAHASSRSFDVLPSTSRNLFGRSTGLPPGLAFHSFAFFFFPNVPLLSTSCRPG